MRSLGFKATYNLTIAEAHGLGAENCFTLFPGCWHGAQSGRFSRQNLHAVLGIGERVLRGILIKKFRGTGEGFGVHDEAIVQYFKHSQKVQHMSRLRNSLNDMQKVLFNWT